MKKFKKLWKLFYIVNVNSIKDLKSANANNGARWMSAFYRIIQTVISQSECWCSAKWNGENIVQLAQGVEKMLNLFHSFPLGVWLKFVTTYYAIFISKANKVFVVQMKNTEQIMPNMSRWMFKCFAFVWVYSRAKFFIFV
jgi:hypothetical protein